jgi:hypothetical protein
MIYVLDTHVVYWYLFEPARLSTACRQAISEGETGKAGLMGGTLIAKDRKIQASPRANSLW